MRRKAIFNVIMITALAVGVTRQCCAFIPLQPVTDHCSNQDSGKAPCCEASDMVISKGATTAIPPAPMPIAAAYPSTFSRIDRDNVRWSLKAELESGPPELFLRDSTLRI